MGAEPDEQLETLRAMNRVETMVRGTTDAASDGASDRDG